MASEIEVQLDESSSLLQSSGGVFEVEYKNQLIFSKKAKGRFPADGEVLRVFSNLEQGMPLEQAQEEAAKGVPAVPSFLEWLTSFMQRKSKNANRV